MGDLGPQMQHEPLFKTKQAHVAQAQLAAAQLQQCGYCTESKMALQPQNHVQDAQGKG